MSNMHDGKGRDRHEIKADKARCHDEMIKNVPDKAKEAFNRPAYLQGKKPGYVNKEFEDLFK